MGWSREQTREYYRKRYASMSPETKSGYLQLKNNQAKKYYETHKEERRKYQKLNRKEYYRIIRSQYWDHKKLLIDIYGGKCLGCGETDIDVLTMDHINNDGGKKRKAGKDKDIWTQLWRLHKKGIQRFDLQLLCANCQIRKFKYGLDFSKWPNRKSLFLIDVDYMGRVV